MDTLKRLAEIRREKLAKINVLDEERRRLAADLADIDAAERVWRRYLADDAEADKTDTIPEEVTVAVRSVIDPSAKPAMSQTDTVLAVLRAASPNTRDRQAIIEEAKQTYGVTIRRDAVTTALLRWKERGRVRCFGRDWQYIEAQPDAGAAPGSTEPPGDDQPGGSGEVGFRVNGPTGLLDLQAYRMGGGGT